MSLVESIKSFTTFSLRTLDSNIKVLLVPKQSNPFVWKAILLFQSSLATFTRIEQPETLLLPPPLPSPTSFSPGEADVSDSFQ